MMYEEYPDVGVIAGDLNGNPTKVRLNKSGLSQFLVGDDVNLIALLFEPRFRNWPRSGQLNLGRPFKAGAGEAADMRRVSDA